MPVIKCSSYNCINIKDGNCTLNIIELDRIAYMTDDDNEEKYDNCAFECLNYTDGITPSIVDDKIED